MLTAIATLRRYWERYGLYSRCKFIETSKDVWIESDSKLKVNDEHGLHKDRDKALRNCMTYGASFGYSAEATERSWGLIKEYLTYITNELIRPARERGRLVHEGTQ